MYLLGYTAVQHSAKDETTTIPHITFHETTVFKTVSLTPSPTVTNTPTTSPSPTPTPTCTPTPTPSPTPSPTPTPTPSPKPKKGLEGQTTFKSYMSWRAITLTTSPQYALQKKAYTGEYGIRMVDGRYCVAMGSYWARTIGTKLDVTLDSGEVLHVILGDCKQDRHTNSNHMYGATKGDVLEFIVEIPEMPDDVRISGNYNLIFKGKVVSVVVVE